MRVVIHTREELYPCVIVSDDPVELDDWPDRTYEIPDHLYEAYVATRKVLLTFEADILRAANPHGRGPSGPEALSG
jgi:hypothetical protein